MEKYPDLIKIGQDLANCCKSSTFNKNYCIGELKRIKDGGLIVKNQIVLKDMRVPEDLYNKTMDIFLLDSYNVIKSLEDKLNDLDNKLKEICELYNEPLDDTLKEPNALFGKILQFVNDVNESHDKNLKDIEAEEKKRKLEEKKKKQAKKNLNEEKIDVSITEFLIKNSQEMNKLKENEKNL
jgi:hypothetical protein